MTADGVSKPGRARGGRLPATIFWIAACAVVALTWPTWVNVARVWSHQFGYSHGFLVAPIAAWLAWRALGRSADQPPVPATAMLGAVVLTSFMWLFLRLASIRTLEQVAAVALLWATATAILGWRLGRVLLFPIGYLLFAIPIWEGLAPVLQPLTSAAASTICELLGIPTYLEGNVVHIPNGVFSIREGCAGNHYLVASITIASLYGYLEYKRWRSSFILVGLSAMLAVVCNWFRVAVVIYAGYATDMQHPWVKDHNMVGWALFTVALVPLFYVARRLERDSGGEVYREPGISAVSEPAGPRRLAAVSVAALVAAGWPQAVGHLRATPEGSAAVTAMAAPTGKLGWRGPLAPDVDWTPAFPAADVRFRAAYQEGPALVTLFYAGYAVQADGREVISYDNRIEGREDYWTPAEDAASNIPGLGHWRRSVLAGRAGRRRVVLYRYTIAGRPTASLLEAKIRQGWKGLGGNRSASILAVSALCRDSCQAVDHDLIKFLTEMDLGGSAALAIDPIRSGSS